MPGMGMSTILPSIDFETYSEAGFLWNEALNEYEPPPNARIKGLPSIGAAAYAMHPSTEILSMAYDLRDGQGPQLWKPGDLIFPPRLYDHIAKGGLLQAWNAAFERWIWMYVGIYKYRFPDILPHQWRCAKAKAAAYGIPASLDNAGKILNITNKKDKDGKRLLNKFSMPRDPTKKDPRKRIYPRDDIEDAHKLYAYNIRDIQAEAEIASLIPDLIPEELEFWQCDQSHKYPWRTIR